MATTSKFVLLNDAVLLEYIYADQEAINSPGNQYRIPTTTAALWKTQNLHINEDQILNDDAAEILQDGVPVGTANVRNHSFAQISKSKIAYLDIDRIIFYNDFDSDLTPSGSLPINFNTYKSPVYDTIRLHLVQGFNFQGNEGLALSIKGKRKDGKNLSLLNLLYTKADSWETMNPSSFLFGGRVYDSYIEMRVLSLYNLVYDYWYTSLNGDSVAERITDQVGLALNQNIQIDFSWLTNPTFVNGQNYMNFFEQVQVEIPTKDQFNGISAYIGESTSGDYIEFYGKFGDDIIENFIIDINSAGNDYMLLHDLNVFEYVYDQTSATYTWVQTADVQMSQIDNYDIPNTFRPVIKNGNAISFKIDYVLRLYNRNDNSQIWRTASILSQKVNKYGRTLKAINLGSNPVQTKIYNQLVTKEIKVESVIEPITSNVKYLTSFADNNAISVSFDNFTSVENATTSTVIQNGTKLKIYGQGLARILVAKGTSYLKFTMYQVKNNANTVLDLSGLGDVVLGFNSNTNEDILFEEYPTSQADKQRGEVVFRLNEAQSTNVLGLKNREFNLYIRNEKGTTAGLTGATSVIINPSSSIKGEKQILYTGKFYSQSEYAKLRETDRVTDLEQTIVEKNSTINDLNSTLANRDLTISELNQSLATANSVVGNLNSMNSELNMQLSKLKSQILSNSIEDATEDAAYQSTIDNLTKSLSNRDTTIGSQTSQIQQLLSQKSTLETTIANLNSTITNLNNVIASLRATPPTLPAISTVPKQFTNFGVSNNNMVISPAKGGVVNYNESLLPGSANIANVNASNFSVSPVTSNNLFTNVSVPAPVFSPVLSSAKASVPAPFQNFGVSTSGSSAKGTNAKGG